MADVARPSRLTIASAAGRARDMCNKCFNGLWCVDEKQQYDKFVCGFTKKKAAAPAAIIISTAAPKPAADSKQSGDSSKTQPQQ